MTQTSHTNQINLSERAISVIHKMLEESSEKYPGQLDRVREMVGNLLSGVVVESDNPRQRPYFYFPYIKNQPWYNPADFEAVGILESNWHTINTELERALRQMKGFEPYIHQTARETDPFEGDMNVFFLRNAFTNDRERLERNRKICPETTAIVDNLPRSGEIALISALNPHTHLPPHCGAENLRQTIHLALRVPEGCELRVCDERHGWTPGKCMAFDDSFEHEAWNRSDKTRFVLLLDVWHPDLLDGEIYFFKRVGPLLNESTDDEESRLAQMSLDGKKWWTD
jgi:aspartate beta-hydroxylase